jgi:hypothetical protein
MQIRRMTKRREWEHSWGRENLPGLTSKKMIIMMGSNCWGWMLDIIYIVRCSLYHDDDTTRMRNDNIDIRHDDDYYYLLL